IESMKSQAGSVYQLGKAIGSYPWTFQVNGQKMFAKGANWIPLDHLLRLTPQRYRRLLQLAKDANFNLLRIWGGGLYETDDFYQLCDELGILAWQEFLSNKNFSNINRTNFLEGVQATILRIRNHPSLAFYCGGNEFDPDDHGSKAIIDALEKMIRELDPDKEFHRASPYMGDDHYWGVWHGKEPYTRYRIVRPFRSEAGVNTFPVIENYRKFTPAEKLWPPDEVFIEYHGENRGKYVHLDKLNRYADEFGDSASIEEFIRKSQLYQALANAFNMEFCRAHKFENSGLLFWQYNDSWPCISWSIVDWYGTPKPAYYWIKRASERLHIASDFEKYLWKTGEQFKTDIWLLNDNSSPSHDLRYNVYLFDIYGQIISFRSGGCQIHGNFSQIIDELNWQIDDNMQSRTFFIAARLLNSRGDFLSGTIYPIAVAKSTIDPKHRNSYNAIFAEMNNMPAASVEAVLSSGQFQLTADGAGSAIVKLFNNSAQLAFFIRLRLDQEFGGFFADYSDNYFSLLPGETRDIEITFRQRHSLPSKAPLTLIIDGWNCRQQRLPIEIR
ncbi:MAG: glycoside hydrolase family 2 protein, partial [bacterium]|nr:glycoside hydrolase family 2 protein [bacterium]